MDNATFWTAIGASGAVGGAVGAVMAAAVAWHQLRQLSRAAGSTALLGLYQVFDNQASRDLRRTIYQDLQRKPPAELRPEDWGPIEKTATEMDLVGTMVRHKLVDPTLVYERYADVIVSIWDAVGEHVKYRNALKGNFSWQNYIWLVKEAKTWSKKYRGIEHYSRFQPDART